MGVLSANLRILTTASWCDITGKNWNQSHMNKIVMQSKVELPWESGQHQAMGNDDSYTTKDNFASLRPVLFCNLASVLLFSVVLWFLDFYFITNGIKNCIEA